MAVKSDTHSDEYVPKPSGGDYSDSRSPQEKRGGGQDYSGSQRGEVDLESTRSTVPDPFHNYGGN
jgi:hypothetical protein